MKNATHVVVGQRWLDLDGRPPNRELLVGSVRGGYATCRVFVNGIPQRRYTTIRCDRFKEGSRGYKLISAPPADLQEDQNERSAKSV